LLNLLVSISDKGRYAKYTKVLRSWCRKWSLWSINIAHSKSSQNTLFRESLWIFLFQNSKMKTIYVWNIW